jgi:hypothetical protein
MADENDTKPTPATNEAIEAPVASEASSSSSTSSTTAPPAATAVTESTTPSMPPKSDEPKNQAVPTKFELPEDLKSIHDSPAPRDGPISQPDDQPTDPEEREKLLENAITFLERSRDAPLDQKQEFLRAKGLTPEEVEDLILKLERKQRKREGKRRERNGQVNIRVFWIEEIRMLTGNSLFAQRGQSSQHRNNRFNLSSLLSNPLLLFLPTPNGSHRRPLLPRDP